MLVEGRGV